MKNPGTTEQGIDLGRVQVRDTALGDLWYKSPQRQDERLSAKAAAEIGSEREMERYLWR